MPNRVTLVETEKTYNLQSLQVFTLTFTGDQSPNKIQLTNIFKSNQLDPVKITLVNLPNKIKRQGAKKKLKIKKRPTKYYVKLKVGQVLDDKKLEKMFPNLSNSK